MSVSRTDYIMFGWKLPIHLKNKNGAIDLWADKFLPFIEVPNGAEYALIIDQMCGQYIVFGNLLARATDDGYCWGFSSLDFSVNREAVILKYTELFETDTPPSEPYLFIFSHFG